MFFGDFPPLDSFVSPTELHTLIPNEKAEFTVNTDDKYDGLPAGFYRFIFKFNVTENDGEEVIYQAYQDFDMSI